jgi:hypothetical protein
MRSKSRFRLSTTILITILVINLVSKCNCEPQNYNSKDKSKTEDESEEESDNNRLIQEENEQELHTRYLTELTEEERISAFEKLWADPEEITVTAQDKKVDGRNKWSKEDNNYDANEVTKDEAEMTDTERVVQAIKMRFVNPDAIQVNSINLIC